MNYKQRRLGYNNQSQRVTPSEMLFENYIMNKPEIHTENWLTTKNASAYLGITPNALRILVHKGKVNAFKIGNHLRFNRPDLCKLLSPKEN